MILSGVCLLHPYVANILSGYMDNYCLGCFSLIITVVNLCNRCVIRVKNRCFYIKVIAILRYIVIYECNTNHFKMNHNKLLFSQAQSFLVNVSKNI